MISGVFESLGFRLSINCYIVSGLRPGIIPLPLPGAQGMGPNIRLLSYVSEIVIECDRRADVQAEREVPVGYFVVAVLFDELHESDPETSMSPRSCAHSVDAIPTSAKQRNSFFIIN